jgi:hypothetical protein
MRRRFYSILLIFSTILLVLSCGNRVSDIKKDTDQISASEKMKSPGIVFITEMHNFGTLKVGEVVSFSFMIMNNGRIPFRITKAETTCGCLSVKYDKKEIAPGEKSAIEVILNTSGEWGNQLKMVEVETSAGEKKELKVGAYIENEQFNNLLNTQK